MRSSTVLLLIFVIGSGCSDRASDMAAVDDGRQTVTILAAASLSESLEKATAAIEQQLHNIDVVISTGPSNALAQQIFAGAEADLFFSASRQWADEIEKHGLAADLVDVLSNQLVLIAPKGNPAEIHSLRDVTSDKVRFFAMAGENVPAGAYADQSLSQSGLLQPLAESHRIVRGNDVRATLSFVERGDAEAGVVYVTDAKLSSKVEVIFELDPTTHDPIVYTLVLLRQTPESEPSETVRAVFDALQAEVALSQFESFNFRRLLQLNASGVRKP